MDFRSSILVNFPPVITRFGWEDSEVLTGFLVIAGLISYNEALQYQPATLRREKQEPGCCV